MGLLDFLKQKKQTNTNNLSQSDLQHLVADSSSISPDEKSYYQPDTYYTLYSYPGTSMAMRVITFEERKKITYPSSRGLYVGEIMLLHYCKDHQYPKPTNGYPGFWWFKYGIRDVGHALQSLEERGFIQWASKKKSLDNLKLDELKRILSEENITSSGKKADLIDRIISEIPDDKLIIPNYTPKYELTLLGEKELEENEYIPYMHNHSHLTTEDSRFGETFTVWDINRLFPDGNAKDWRKVVGNIEMKRFGVNMADVSPDNYTEKTVRKKETTNARDEMRAFIATKQSEINQGIKSPGDGFTEESQGLDFKKVGKDKEALVKFYIAIGKRFNAPALYQEAAVILRKYKMYEEELSVIETGIQIVPRDNPHRKELIERKNKVKELMKKDS